MPDSKMEAALVALHAAVLAAAPSGAKVQRNGILPERIPPAGMIIVRDGGPGEPEVTLSPLYYHYEHLAKVEIIVDRPAATADRLEAHAADVDTALDQPEDRCRQLAAELGRGQDDADVLREGILVGLVPPEKVEQLGPRIGVSLADLREITSEHIGGLVEGHGRDHRRVAEGLQLHVAAVLGPLELDHHEVRVAVDAEEIDTPARLVPVPELLRDDQRVRSDDRDVCPQKALQVAPLLQLRDAECGLAERPDFLAGKWRITSRGVL